MTKSQRMRNSDFDNRTTGSRILFSRDELPSPITLF